MDYTGFKSWLQCYFVDGMKSIRDHNGRTMWFKVSAHTHTHTRVCLLDSSCNDCFVWFQGDPGPMAPKGEAVAEPKTSPTVSRYRMN